MKQDKTVCSLCSTAEGCRKCLF